MSNFWFGFWVGVLSSLVAAGIVTFLTRALQERRNTRQWKQIERFLSTPMLTRAVSGTANIIGRVNDTPWTVIAQMHIEDQLGEDVAQVFQLNERDWKPNEGAVWNLNKRLADLLKNPQTKVYLDISYEPVHKNTGKVRGARIGDRVHLRQLHFMPRQD